MKAEKRNQPVLQSLVLCGWLFLLAVMSGCATSGNRPTSPTEPGLYLTYDDQTRHYHGVVGPVTDSTSLLYFNRVNGNEVQITTAKTAEDDQSVTAVFNYTLTTTGQPPRFEVEKFTFSKSHPARIILLTGIRVSARYEK